MSKSEIERLRDEVARLQAMVMLYRSAMTKAGVPVPSILKVRPETMRSIYVDGVLQKDAAAGFGVAVPTFAKRFKEWWDALPEEEKDTLRLERLRNLRKAGRNEAVPSRLWPLLTAEEQRVQIPLSGWTDRKIRRLPEDVWERLDPSIHKTYGKYRVSGADLDDDDNYDYAG